MGDARDTDMVTAGTVDVGQLARGRGGEHDVVLEEVGSHSGTVVATQGWGDPAGEVPVPAARPGTVDALLHAARSDTAAPLVLSDRRPEPRDPAVGVLHHSEAERWGNDVPSGLGGRYDGFLWFDRTLGLSPLRYVRAAGGETETWPHGR